MKKLLATIGLIIIGLQLRLPLSFAATTTTSPTPPPVFTETALTTTLTPPTLRTTPPLATAPAPTATPPPTTTTTPTPKPTPAPAPAPSTSPPTLRISPPKVATPEPVPTTTTGTTPTTSATTTDSSGTTMGTTITPTMLPTPTDIAVIPTVTQEPLQPACGTTGTTPCEVKVQKISNSQVLIGEVLALSSFTGGMLWMLAMLMMKGGVLYRAEGNSQRQNRMKLGKILTAKKLAAYDQYIDSVMSAVLNGKDLAAFRDSSAYIKINGGKNMLAINDQIIAMVEAGKPITAAERLNLKTDLIKFMKTDLMRSPKFSQ